MKNLIKYLTGATFIFCLAIGLIIGPKKIALVLNNKAVELYNKGETQSAIEIYTKSIKLHPNAQVYYNLACAYDAQNIAAKAIENYKNALSLDARQIAACRALADIYREQKDFGQAEMYLKKLNALNNQSAETDLSELKNEQLITLCNEAVSDYEQNDTKQAINKLSQVLKLDHGFAPAHKILGEIYLNQNDLGKAIVSYNAALKAGDNSPQVYSNIGLIYMRLENYPQAVEFLEKAQKLDPENLDIKYSFASVLRDNGQQQKALDFYKQIAAESPEYPNVHNDLAGLYQAMGSEKEAMLEFTRAKDTALRLKANGDNQPWTLLSLAIAHNGLNDAQKAKNIIDEIIKENPDFSHAYYIRAQVFKQLGDKQAANKDLGKARQLARKIKPASDRKSNKNKAVPVVKTQTAPTLKTDTVIKLTNGQTMQGKLKTETDKLVVLEINMGSSIGEITFSKKKIQEIIKTK
ncbi:MAG: tetratricopeptide repeat protein [Candidatus Omnitrophota bacterium]